MEFLDYTWILADRDLIQANSSLRSMTFKADTRGQLSASWYLKLYAKGHEGAEEGFCPIYLICEQTNIYPLEVSYLFTLVNYSPQNNIIAKDTNVFEAGKGWGAHRLIQMSQVLDPENGFIRKGQIHIKAELSYVLQKQTRPNYS